MLADGGDLVVPDVPAAQIVHHLAVGVDGEGPGHVLRRGLEAVGQRPHRGAQPGRPGQQQVEGGIPRAGHGDPDQAASAGRQVVGESGQVLDNGLGDSGSRRAVEVYPGEAVAAGLGDDQARLAGCEQQAVGELEPVRDDVHLTVPVAEHPARPGVFQQVALVVREVVSPGRLAEVDRAVGGDRGAAREHQPRTAHRVAEDLDAGGLFTDSHPEEPAVGVADHQRVLVREFHAERTATGVRDRLRGAAGVDADDLPVGEAGQQPSAPVDHHVLGAGAGQRQERERRQRPLVGPPRYREARRGRSPPLAAKCCASHGPEANTVWQPVPGTACPAATRARARLGTSWSAQARAAARRGTNTAGNAG